MKLKPLTLLLLSLILLYSCGNIHETPNGCVVAFIVAAEQRDMTRAWNTLGPEAQSSYNSLGEKMRKSGKGALENEISRITKFRSVKKDYRIVTDSSDANLVKIVTIGGPEHPVETINENGSFKIKDINSVRNLLNGISAEVVKNKEY
jgi:hypothetical protein